MQISELGSYERKMCASLLTCSVQFSCSVMPESLRPHGLQHARLPCLLPTPGDCLNSCPSSWWCHPTISSSVSPFSSCLQYFPALGSFPINQFFTSGGQSIIASSSASVLPMNIQDWFLLVLTGLISSQSKGLKSLLQHHSSKATNSLVLSFLYSPTHIHTWLLGKPYLWLDRPLLAKWCLCFLLCYRLVIAFLPRSDCLLISWLQSPSAVILELNKIKSAKCFLPLFPHLFALKWWDWMPWSLFFECWVFSQLFHSPFSSPSRGCLVPLYFLPLEWCHLHIWGCWYFSCQSWFQFVIHPSWHFAWCTLHIN